MKLTAAHKLIIMSSILCFICVIILVSTPVLDSYDKLTKLGIIAVPIGIMLLNSLSLLTITKKLNQKK